MSIWFALGCTAAVFVIYGTQKEASARIGKTESHSTALAPALTPERRSKE